MRVLIACEHSGTVRDAFRALGHDAVSCDLLPPDKPGPHYQGDVSDIIADGVTWLHKDPRRWEKLDEAAQFFSALLNAPIPRIAIENPIMHKYAKERIGGIKQTQVIQPWMFGHQEQKATCLWLKGLSALTPTNDVKEQMLKLPSRARQRLYYLSPSADRWKIRSTTYQGIADAMAEQWG